MVSIKDDISLVTHHDEEHDRIADSLGFFQKNGDISNETGGTAVGGVFGVLIGALIGVVTLTVPLVGLIIGTGPMMSAIFGGVLGGAIGNEIVKSIDVEYSETSPLHPYIAALKEGDVICGVEVSAEKAKEIQNMMSQYATHTYS